MAKLSDIFGDVEETKEIQKIASAIAETANPAQDFVMDLISWLENERTEKIRSPGLHCSSLWETCARRELLKVIYADTLVEKKIKAGERLTYDMGHALHHLIQNDYLGPFGRLWGDWKCLGCQKIVFRGTMPISCPTCELPWRNQEDGHQNIVYSELLIQHPELDYQGHCDGVLLGRLPTKRVFEFKTKSKSMYDTLRHPDMPHVVQVHGYMHALDISEAILLYLDKGSQCDWTRDEGGKFIAGAPHLKAFVVKFDNELWSHMEKRIRDYHASHRKIKELPVITEAMVMGFPRICSHFKCELALSCEVAGPCFKLGA